MNLINSPKKFKPLCGRGHNQELGDGWAAPQEFLGAQGMSREWAASPGIQQGAGIHCLSHHPSSFQIKLESQKV